LIGGLGIADWVIGDWELAIGDWGLGIGDWRWSIRQSSITNCQSTNLQSAIANRPFATRDSDATHNAIAGSFSEHCLGVGARLDAVKDATKWRPLGHTARLIKALQPETLWRLVEMGGDASQRRAFTLDATSGRRRHRHRQGRR
jgi:hypothetical protein